jgi:hypothetical protein
MQRQRSAEGGVLKQNVLGAVSARRRWSPHICTDKIVTIQNYYNEALGLAERANGSSRNSHLDVVELGAAAMHMSSRLRPSPARELFGKPWGNSNARQSCRESSNMYMHSTPTRLAKV